ncbi:class I SAM-dependent methyltransferase [Defluviimonas aestuarii]|uniref:class I SAM-dependent methyltransferase n=1 Tax=Albidovulum aestuarii TaxID=1130726 RepID=UPI00249B44D8|nr:class I SAM-dependent methyltransferase [Defluviimonas aestuarii]MDI3337220.1 class I SAM-dependent methyltransferase [Defluviimonas aestuarii]
MEDLVGGKKEVLVKSGVGRVTSFPKCRNCGAEMPLTLVDLGLSAVANSYVPIDRADAPEPRYPLHVRVCEACWLVQVDEDVPPEKIFTKDYAYFSSFSSSWLAHARAYAEMMTNRLGLGSDSLVIEIASNDGYLLKNFVAAGIPVLGIEPSGSVAAAAEKIGVPTLVEFFGADLAKRLFDEGRRPDLICSANVLAHVPDIDDFVAGVAALLTGDAVYTVEFPHLLRLIEEVQFDTIYHEHYSYLSLLAVEGIFTKHGLRVFDVEELPTHGGSLRVFACRNEASHAEGQGVAKVRTDEATAHLNSAEGYQGFSERCEAVRDGLRNFLDRARADGKLVAAYGAAAKGNTLLNYCGIGPDLVSYCVDRNPAKQDTLLPGSSIPVFDVPKLTELPPDFVLILPWNLKSEIIAQLKQMGLSNTRFVTAVPSIKVTA